ncbi:MAG: DedA family protein [Alphaproteobacteria bacterium]|nr:DedA family protein [Alphaproteobacteria bacterium]
MHALLGFISSHAHLALPTVFLVTFGESFAFVSFFFPGTTVILACGALIAAHALPAWPVIIGGIAGAVLGDSCSFWLGRRYGHLTETVWPFTRHPEMLTRGYEFFSRHGAKSIFLGRFLGPFRAVLPLLAGITKMSSARFWLANVTSAIIWVPALLAPGVLAGYGLSMLGAHRNWMVLAGLAITLSLAAAIVIVRRRGYLRGLKLDA